MLTLIIETCIYKAHLYYRNWYILRLTLIMETGIFKAHPNYGNLYLYVSP